MAMGYLDITAQSNNKTDHVANNHATDSLLRTLSKSKSASYKLIMTLKWLLIVPGHVVALRQSQQTTLHPISYADPYALHFWLNLQKREDERTDLQQLTSIVVYWDYSLLLTIHDEHMHDQIVFNDKRFTTSYHYSAHHQLY